MCLQNRRANTHLFYDSVYDDTFKPYYIDMDVNTILINASRTQAPTFHESTGTRFLSKGITIWRQIPNEDHAIILDGCPDDTVSGLTDITSPSSREHNWDTFSHTCGWTSLCKVHFSNHMQADD
jgi:hypothetical protein